MVGFTPGHTCIALDEAANVVPVLAVPFCPHVPVGERSNLKTTQIEGVEKGGGRLSKRLLLLLLLGKEL